MHITAIRVAARCLRLFFRRAILNFLRQIAATQKGGIDLLALPTGNRLSLKTD